LALTKRPTHAADAAWKNDAERPGYIEANKLRFLRPYQLRAIHALQRAVHARQTGR
jgi:type I restriction enzyme R subunit